MKNDQAVVMRSQLGRDSPRHLREEGMDQVRNDEPDQICRIGSPASRQRMWLITELSGAPQYPFPGFPINLGTITESSRNGCDRDSQLAANLLHGR